MICGGRLSPWLKAWTSAPMPSSAYSTTALTRTSRAGTLSLTLSGCVSRLSLLPRNCWNLPMPQKNIQDRERAPTSNIGVDGAPITPDMAREMVQEVASLATGQMGYSEDPREVAWD